MNDYWQNTYGEILEETEEILNREMNHRKSDLMEVIRDVAHINIKGIRIQKNEKNIWVQEITEVIEEYINQNMGHVRSPIRETKNARVEVQRRSYQMVMTLQHLESNWKFDENIKKIKLVEFIKKY